MDNSEMWSHKMPKGLNLEIAHHPMTMKRVANLIIAMERLKAGSSESVLSTDFQDEHLLNIMLENFVEERLVLETTSSSHQFISTGENEFSVTDTQKRNLVLVRDSMELHAVMLQAGSNERKVLLNMSTYVHPTTNVEARPVTLGIKGTDFYLSCHKDGNEPPTLHIEKVMDKSSLSNISEGSEMVRFLFYKKDTGRDVSTLMSAHFHNWYISTAQQQDSQPVEMCQKAAALRCTTFSFQRQS
ncbi:interleukin-1 beta-like [Pholidichthys leucotaenia]